MPSARFEQFTVAELKILKQAIAQGLSSKAAQATGRKLTKELEHSLKRKESFDLLNKKYDLPTGKKSIIDQIVERQIANE